MFHETRTTAHRLASSPEAWIERFGEDVLLSYKHDAARDVALGELQAWEASNGLRFRRVFGKFLARHNDERAAPLLIAGTPAPPLTAVVQENGLSFGLDFAAGYSAGLFIDQRANRAFLRHAAPKRLLNTFAYTCAFSVAAAISGAESWSIDLSKKSLSRGRENFARNDLPLESHRFIADDVHELLPRLARRGELFDAIVLDPPTFSRGNDGRRFQIEGDLEPLLIAALGIAAPKAIVLISTNCTRLSQRDLERTARYALKLTRRAGDFHREPALLDIPTEFASRTLWLVLK